MLQPADYVLSHLYHHFNSAKRAACHLLASHKLLLLILLNHTRPSRSTPWRTSSLFTLRVGRQPKQFSAENKS
jgi:hypothetical protein